jgi:thioredoxin-like negative regulator of GroEL
LATLSDLTQPDLLEAAIASPGTLVLDVYTQSCVICRRVEPMVAAAAAAASGGAIRAHKVDAEAQVDFATRYNIHGVPTLLLFRDGQLVDRRSGFLTASAMREWIGAAGAG